PVVSPLVAFRSAKGRLSRDITFCRKLRQQVRPPSRGAAIFSPSRTWRGFLHQEDPDARSPPRGPAAAYPRAAPARAQRGRDGPPPGSPPASRPRPVRPRPRRRGGPGPVLPSPRGRPAAAGGPAGAGVTRPTPHLGRARPADPVAPAAARPRRAA